MTHPEIVDAEIFGSRPYRDGADRMGRCLQCEAPVHRDTDAVESADGLFCDMSCCCEYYEIRHI